MTEREALVRAVNQNPYSTTSRLVLADWCDDNGESGRAARLRRGFRVSFGFGGGGGFGVGGFGGVGGGGVGGFGGFGGVGFVTHNPNGVVMPEIGARVVAFVPRGGYSSGFAVFVGAVCAELARGFALHPARNIERVNRNNADDSRWIELANGVKEVRSLAQYSDPLALPIEIPDGCMFWGWVGEQP